MNPAPRKASKEKDSVLPTARLLKLFQLIAILKAGRWTIKQLVERLDSSKSTLYRYLELLEEAGFCVDKDFHDRHFIVTTDDDPLQAQVTQEEMNLLRTLIQGDPQHPLTASLLKKLSLHSELDSMPRLFLKAHLGNLVEQLHHALRNKHQVILKNYHSANSNEVRDRLVEPIHFADNYSAVIALDTETQTCKQYKLDRISEVIETHTPFAFAHLHEEKAVDSFGITGTASNWVTLLLSDRAWLLLREEHPLTQHYLKKHDDGYRFHGPVAHYNGIGRFVLGLIDEITIESPADFKEYIKQKMMKQLLKQG